MSASTTGSNEEMTVIEITKPGEAAVLQPRKRAIPAPGPGEVLIRVAAAGVNRPDVLQRKGAYPPPPGASDLPGLEVAGIVTACGQGVSRPRPGDRVCALTAGGGYAQYCLADARHCLPVPAPLSMSEAAALPETFFTVWTNVFDRGRLQRGENFLVHGGSSGIGTTAIQLAHAFGARVFTTAGSEEKCDACRRLGADVAINYRERDFVEIVRRETGEGVDLILDMVGGDYIPRNMKALAPDGRLVNIAFLNGAEVTVNFAVMMVKRLTLTGSTLRPQSREAKAAIAEALRRNVWPLLEEGRIRPVMDSTYPLTQAADAHKRMEGGHHIGKIVLIVDPEIQ